MIQTVTVTKRNGRKEPLDLNKFHKVVAWACEGISNVSESEIELKSLPKPQLNRIKWNPISTIGRP